ncbi:hypothetical protein HHK36_008383 [Tetracentron sinense]|uniref:BHLH domain-containing protein n=1 Tax=Tetracentron sinense TaxID=13715 RepID=A0A834ZJE8_TETSI|nr:hypothetical protein HHK36_008383 [Tetracentron sinense]
MRIRMTPPAPPPRQGQAKCSPFSFPPSFSTSTAGYCHVKPLPEDQNRPSRSTSLSGSDFRVRDETSTTESSTEVDSFSGLIRSSSGAFFPADMKYSSGNISSVGASDSDAITAPAERRNFPAGNDLDVYDCESEEGLWKATPRRSSSKRSRAAEVHNLSEKRRRSRINEKMKALQNLIPNSNKTDKASMLDEAIEYLKQLQLQVQVSILASDVINEKWVSFASHILTWSTAAYTIAPYADGLWRGKWIAAYGHGSRHPYCEPRDLGTNRVMQSLAPVNYDKYHQFGNLIWVGIINSGSSWTLLSAFKIFGGRSIVTP